MIQYINKLQDKQVKVKILQHIINKVRTDNLIIRNYNLRMRKTVIDLGGKKYKVTLYVSSRYVQLSLTSVKYVAYFVRGVTNKYYKYSYDWETNLDLFLCFTPSKEDLYNIFFKTNKRLFFTLHVVNSKLLQYALSYKEKSYEKKKKK